MVFKQDSGLGLGGIGKTCGHPEEKQGSWGYSYQNTVCLRVSQLECVAASATRQNLFKKRMTGKLFISQDKVGKHTIKGCTPRQNERRE